MNALKGDRIDRVGRGEKPGLQGRTSTQLNSVAVRYCSSDTVWDTVWHGLLWQSVNVTHCSSNILWHTVFLCACSVPHSVQCQCSTLYHTAFHHIALCGYSVHTLGFVSIGMSNWIPAHYWSINFLRQRIGQHVSTGCLVLWCFQSVKCQKY